MADTVPIYKHIPRHPTTSEILIDSVPKSEVDGYFKRKTEITVKEKKVTDPDFYDRMAQVTIAAKNARIVYYDTFWEILSNLILTNISDLLLPFHTDINQFYPMSVKYFAKDNSLTNLDWKEMNAKPVTYFRERQVLADRHEFVSSAVLFKDEFYNAVDAEVEFCLDRQTTALDFEVTVLARQEFHPDLFVPIRFF